MNDKEEILMQIVDLTVECCSVNVNGRPTVTHDELLGTSRRENVVWTRCMLASEIKSIGFCTETIAMLLNRSEKAVRDMLEQAENLRSTSRAFKVAESQLTIKVNELF